LIYFGFEFGTAGGVGVADVGTVLEIDFLYQIKRIVGEVYISVLVVGHVAVGIVSELRGLLHAVVFKAVLGGVGAGGIVNALELIAGVKIR
jgi:hypothetical protein